MAAAGGQQVSGQWVGMVQFGAFYGGGRNWFYRCLREALGWVYQISRGKV